MATEIAESRALRARAEDEARKLQSLLQKAELITVPRATPSVKRRIDAAFYGKAKTKSAALGEEDVLQVLYATERVVQPPFDMDEFADFYERNHVLRACVDEIADSVVGMGHEIISKQKPRSGSDITPATDDHEPDPDEREWLAQVFDEPNTEDLSVTEVLRLALIDRLVLGNGYIEITRNGSNQIDGLHHLPARTMRIRLDEDGKIAGYVQVVGRKTQEYRKFGDENRRFAIGEAIKAQKAWKKRWCEVAKAGLWIPNRYESEVDMSKADEISVRELTEVWWWRDYSPRRGLYGVPKSAAAFEDMVGLANYKLYNADYFECGTIPAAILLIRGGLLATNLRKEIEKYLETEGRGEYHKLVLLSASEDTQLDHIQLADAMQHEASHLGYAEKCEKNTAMPYRVPYSQLTESQRRAPGQAEQDAIRLRERVVRPMQRWLCAGINGLIIRRDMDVRDWEFKLLEGDLTEMTARAAACERGIRAGSITPNEYRAIVHDLPPMDGGGVASKTLPGVGIVPTPLVQILLDAAMNAGPDAVLGLLRPIAGGDGNGNGQRESIRDAARKAGIDDDLIDALLEEMEMTQEVC